MRFSVFRQANDRLRVTTGVLEKEAIVRNVLESCEVGERHIAAYMLTGRLGTPLENVTSGIKEAYIARDLGMEGRQAMEDIAKVAMERAETGESNPTLGNVWQAIRAYAMCDDRSNKAKSRIVNELLFGFARTKEDIPLLLQILAQKVNNGVQDLSVLYGWYMVRGTTERAMYARAFSLRPDIGFWVQNLIRPEDVTVQPGIPLEPQRCARVKTVKDVLMDHQGATMVQRKLDGQRIHIHIWRSGGLRNVRLFSHELKDVTENYPEVVAACATVPVERFCVLDGELVALDENDEAAPFSVLQKRLGRKEDRQSVRVGVVLYDVLAWDDQQLSEVAYGYRLVLAELASQDNPVLRVIPSEIVTDANLLQEVLLNAADDGEEGLVCKDPTSFPSPGARNKDWIKLKVDYLGDEFADTYDLVVIGYNRGRGKRHGRVGALWVGIRCDDDIIPICKVGTGFSDEELDWWTANLHAIPDKPSIVDLNPTNPEDEVWPNLDHWVDPQHVIEVRATGGMTSIDYWAQFSLRFPRFVRRRTDKSVAQATSTAEVQIP